MSKTRYRDMQYRKRHMLDAMNSATLSYANRLKVGAVIVRDGHTVVDGRNGTMRGMNNCCEEMVINCTCGTEHVVPESDLDNNILCSCGESIVVDSSTVKYKTKNTVIHAEANAILYAAKSGIPLYGTIMYTTHAPCDKCAAMIITCGIKAVYFINEFKHERGIKLLKDAHVGVFQLSIS